MLLKLKRQLLGRFDRSLGKNADLYLQRWVQGVKMRWGLQQQKCVNFEMNHFIHTLQSADIEVDAQNLRRHGGNCEWDSFKKIEFETVLWEQRNFKRCRVEVTKNSYNGNDSSNRLKNERRRTKCLEAGGHFTSF
jgi:hypothetical protein